MSVAVWEPRIALTAAEEAVDFVGHNEHIVQRRAILEEHARPAARRLVAVSEEFGGYIPPAMVERLTKRLEQGLVQTMNFGYRSARKEIEILRGGRTVSAAIRVPDDAGDHAQLASRGREGVKELIALRSRQASAAIAAAVTEAGRVTGLDTFERQTLLNKAAQRALHNSVLELVGETLNMGRHAGALSMPGPPEFAFRSEQLDKTTCDPCSRLHGQIAALGTSEYFALLPPTGCLGGGRCRGIMVFGDGPIDFRTPGDDDEPLDPSGENLRDQVRLVGGSRGALVEHRAQVDEALSAIDELLELPGRSNLPLDGLPITMRRTTTARGHLKRQGPDPVEINVSPVSVHPGITFAHEVGHLLDLSYLRTGRTGYVMDKRAESLGDLADAVEEFREAFRATRAYEILGQYPDALSRYMRGSKEGWARAFSQWVTLRAGSERMRRDLRDELEEEARDRASGVRHYPEWFDDEDWPRLERAVEALLRAAGLLRES